MTAGRYATLLTSLLIAGCQDIVVLTSDPLTSTAEGMSASSDDSFSTSEVAGDASTSSTSSPTSTGAEDTSSSTTTGEHQSPGVCEDIDPANCMPGSTGWCPDVVALCDLLNPQNTNPGFCEDMGFICVNEHVTPCTICEILQTQCEIEAAPPVDCEEYAATCGCLLDAHSWS